MMNICVSLSVAYYFQQTANNFVLKLAHISGLVWVYMYITWQMTGCSADTEQSPLVELGLVF